MTTRKPTVTATPAKTSPTTGADKKPPKGSVTIELPESMKSVLEAYADKVLTEGLGPTFTITDERKLTTSLEVLMPKAEAAAMIAALKIGLKDAEKMYKTGNHPIFPF